MNKEVKNGLYNNRHILKKSADQIKIEKNLVI